MNIESASDPNSEERRIARGWVLRLASGERDENALAELRAWRSAEPANNAAFEAERRLFRSLKPFEAAFAAIEADEPARKGGRARSHRRLLFPAVGALVAVAAAWLAVDPIMLLRADRTTGAGEIAELILPDGSRALLNSESAIDVAYDGQTRRIHLLRGEAWFEVAHDAEHPFIVDADGATARAIGTAYSVRRHDDGYVSIAVTDGVVGFAGSRGGSLSVKAGETAKIDGGALAPRFLDETSGDILAWRSGRIVIENLSLADVATELSRYRRGGILVIGSAASRRVSGVLQVGAIDKGLEGLAAAQGLTITHVTPWVVILR